MPLLHNGHVQPLNPLGVHEGHGESLLQEPSLSHIMAAKSAWSFPKSDKDNKMTTLEIVEGISGLLYLVFTLVLSSYYLQVLSPSMTNDLWWSGFNASGIQSYLIDVYNAQLNLLGNQTLSLDLTDNKYALGKDYTQFYTPIEISPVYPRMIFSIVAYDLAKSIVAIRQIPGPDWIVTQFCWIDFNRTWEVAHTVTRQNRCKARYADNGAVYYEPFARLVDWNKWTESYGIAFNTTIGNALRKSRAGQDWLAQTPYSFVNVDAEVEFWRRHGITQYTFQYSNNFEWRELETISLQNAFGTTQAITIKSSAFANRVGSWTTVWMYYGVWNDLPYAAWQGYSIVLNDPDNQRFMPPCNYSNYVVDPANYSCDPCDPALGLDSTNCYMNYEMFLNLPNTPTFELVHNYIGPFNSIDLYFVQAPPSLIQLYSDFQTLVTQLILSNDAFATAIAAIPSLTTDPVPPNWIQSSFMYLGGDPTCLTRQPTSFVQTSFAFDTSCTFEERTKFTLTPYNTLFALWATSQRNASSICDVCPSLLLYNQQFQYSNDSRSLP
ncbi:hypothetical protein LEN26_018344 [Aphanomyces euteiches]|nr:hypothetical protein LEN26_018344 [Aphanomyces euteiches]